MVMYRSGLNSKQQFPPAHLTRTAGDSCPRAAQRRTDAAPLGMTSGRPSRRRGPIHRTRGGENARQQLQSNVVTIERRRAGHGSVSPRDRPARPGNGRTQLVRLHRHDPRPPSTRPRGHLKTTDLHRDSLQISHHSSHRPPEHSHTARHNIHLHTSRFTLLGTTPHTNARAAAARRSEAADKVPTGLRGQNGTVVSKNALPHGSECAL